MLQDAHSSFTHSGAFQKLQKLQTLLIEQQCLCRAGDFIAAEDCFGAMEECMQAVNKLPFNNAEKRIWQELQVECQRINREIGVHFQNEKKLLAKEYLHNNLEKELMYLNS